MSNKKYPIIRYRQNGLSYISLVLPFEVVDAISHVLIYGIDPDGYQRKPNKIHYNKIKRDALYDQNFRLPTSIILGVDENTIQPLVETDQDGRDYINIETSKRILELLMVNIAYMV
ncbi:hypothetical protein [Paraflavitalea speifideaquila]|uniref:hypothetical protein n=1 Tax=Paraflavitalea speifideaquila TaxID=3076558 RepID=UPI0028EA6B94|nr:hypothetical protein [Paraflavitalea speifideiaquila]